MNEERYQGFVIGYKPNKRGEVVWYVRVSPNERRYQTRTFVVASVHDNVTLSQGLNVNFMIGSIDDSEGRKVPRAVDVKVEQYQNV